MLLVHPDHDARHRLGVSADVLDVPIGHRFRVLAEQFPITRDRNRFRLRICMFDILDGHPCELAVDVCDVVECARSAPTWGRRAHDDERGWRDADTEARDLRSNALIA